MIESEDSGTQVGPLALFAAVPILFFCGTLSFLVVHLTLAALGPVAMRCAEYFFRLQIVLAGLFCVGSWWIERRRRSSAWPPSPPPQAPDGSDGDQRLESIACPACGGNVPLSAATLRCPYCGADVEPRPDYVALLRERERADEALAAAARAWQRARRWVSWPTILLLWSSAFLWFVTAINGLMNPDSKYTASFAVFIGNIIAALIVAAALVGIALMLARARHHIPVAEQHREIASGAAGTARCTVCGGSVSFAASDVARICLYCGAECYRRSFVASARARAQADLKGVMFSLRAAMLAVEKMRRDSGETYLTVVGITLWLLATCIAGALLQPLFADN